MPRPRLPDERLTAARSINLRLGELRNSLQQGGAIPPQRSSGQSTNRQLDWFERTWPSAGRNPIIDQYGDSETDEDEEDWLNPTTELPEDILMELDMSDDYSTSDRPSFPRSQSDAGSGHMGGNQYEVLDAATRLPIFIRFRDDPEGWDGTFATAIDSVQKEMMPAFIFDALLIAGLEEGGSGDSDVKKACLEAVQEQLKEGRIGQHDWSTFIETCCFSGPHPRHLQACPASVVVNTPRETAVALRQCLVQATPGDKGKSEPLFGTDDAADDDDDDADDRIQDATGILPPSLMRQPMRLALVKAIREGTFRLSDP